MPNTPDELPGKARSLREYLNDIAEHGKGCAVYMHSAAECSCGLTKARIDADEIIAAAWDVCTHWADNRLGHRVQRLQDALECASEEPPDDGED